ncbi:MAG: hypothetical protein MJ087_02705 [Lachnospiraceae bacterium]|nr:hypothetical protein [Lachnospiraceae bacterium]
MPEYFKFCPKCGRVLNRDWCTYCEPEKEEAYRREQLERYRIKGDYVSDRGIDHDIHGGFGGIFHTIGSLFVRPSIHEKSVNSGEFVDSVLREQKKAERDIHKKNKARELRENERANRHRQNGEVKRKRNPIIWVIICLIIFNMIPVLFGFLLGVIRNSNIQIPEEVTQIVDQIENIFGYHPETVLPDGQFSDVRNETDDYDEDRLDAKYSLRSYFEGDSFDWDYKGYQYYSGYSYSVFADQDDIMATKGFGKEMQKIAAEAKAKAEACRDTNKDYNFNQYLTYFDENYSAIIHEEYDNDKPRSIHSYLVDNNTLETINLDEKIHLKEMDSDLRDRMGDATGFDFTEEKYDELIKSHQYYYTVDGNGEIYLGFEDFGSYYHVQIGVQLDDIL